MGYQFRRRGCHPEFHPKYFFLDPKILIINSWVPIDVNPNPNFWQKINVKSWQPEKGSSVSIIIDFVHISKPWIQMFKKEHTSYRLVCQLRQSNKIKHQQKYKFSLIHINWFPSKINESILNFKYSCNLALSFKLFHFGILSRNFTNIWNSFQANFYIPLLFKELNLSWTILKYQNIDVYKITRTCTLSEVVCVQFST